MLRILVLMLIVALIGCQIQPPEESLMRIQRPLPVSLKSAVGCWRFDRGANHFLDRVPAGGVVLLDSAQDSILAEYNPRVLHVAVIPSDSAVVRSIRLSGWAADSTDVQLLHLWLGDGFSGSSFRLRQHGDTLSGTVRGYVDHPSFSLTHDVRAIRTLCPTG